MSRYHKATSVRTDIAKQHLPSLSIIRQQRDLCFKHTRRSRHGSPFFLKRPVNAHKWTSLVVYCDIANGENKSSNQGLSLNRSQCGGCSTEYNTLTSSQVVCK